MNTPMNSRFTGQKKKDGIRRRHILCRVLFLLHVIALMCLSGKQALAGKYDTIGHVFLNSGGTPGYLLLAPADSTTTYLIDKKGYVVHKWHSSMNLKPGMSVYLDSAGNLYRAENMGNKYCGYPGGRIAVYSWTDTLIWAYNINYPTFQQTHDIYPMPNGHVLADVWEQKNAAAETAAGRTKYFQQGGLWSGGVVEVAQIPGTQNADTVWSWHLWDHLDNTGTNPQTLNVNDVGTPISGYADWIHMNAVTYNPQLDQIIVSSRNLNEIYIIPHDTSTANCAGPAGNFLFRWGHAQVYGATGGDTAQWLYGQHSPYWIPGGCPNAGQIMINNDGYNRNYTSVNIINPTWTGSSYQMGTGGLFLPDTANSTYNAPTQYWSWTRGNAQQLPNGNLLICAADVDTFYEVQGKPPYNVVWKYSLLDQGGAFRCTQYSESYVDPIRKKYWKSPAKK
jgi:hypothetical protein